jgi:hypothetical protein
LAIAQEAHIGCYESSDFSSKCLPITIDLLLQEIQGSAVTRKATNQSIEIMKPINSLTKSITLAAIMAVSGWSIASQTLAQTTPATPDSASASASDEGEKHHGPWGKLTHDEKMRLKAAHDAAKKDPTVVAAESTRSTDPKAYHEVVRAAMLKADPKIGPLLDKVQKARKDHWAMKTAGLTTDEKAKLKEAHHAAMKDPAVVAAREDAMKADGKDEKKAAWKKFREANKEAMLKADPTLADIFAKMKDTDKDAKD